MLVSEGVKLGLLGNKSQTALPPQSLDLTTQ